MNRKKQKHSKRTAKKQTKKRKKKELTEYEKNMRLAFLFGFTLAAILLDFSHKPAPAEPFFSLPIVQ